MPGQYLGQAIGQTGQAFAQGAQTGAQINKIQQQEESLQKMKNHYNKSIVQDSIKSYLGTAAEGEPDVNQLNRALEIPEVREMFGTSKVTLLNPNDANHQNFMYQAMRKEGAEPTEQDINEALSSGMWIAGDNGNPINISDLVIGTGTFSYMTPKERLAFDSFQAGMSDLLNRSKTSAPGSLEKDISFLQKMFPDADSKTLTTMYKDLKRGAGKPSEFQKKREYLKGQYKQKSDIFQKSWKGEMKDFNPTRVSTKVRQQASDLAQASDESKGIKWTGDEQKNITTLVSASNLADQYVGLDEDPEGNIKEISGVKDNLINKFLKTTGFGNQEEIYRMAKNQSQRAAIRNLLGNALFGSALSVGEMQRQDEAFGTLWQSDSAAMAGFYTQLSQMKSTLDTIRSKNPESFNLRYGNIVDRLDTALENLDRTRESKPTGKKTIIKPRRGKGINPETGKPYTGPEYFKARREGKI